VPSVSTQSMGAEPPSLLSIFCVGVCRLGWQGGRLQQQQDGTAWVQGGGGWGGRRRFRDARPVAART